MTVPPPCILVRLRFRQRRRWNARGVSVILGALLVFVMVVAISGLVVTKGVPAWMGQDEASYVRSAGGALNALASTWETQILLGGPLVLSTSVPLASAGVPLLASPTIATLSFAPRSVGLFESVTVTEGTAIVYRSNVTLGTVTLNVPNRYATPETFRLQGGALLQLPGSGGGSVVTDPPISLFSNGSVWSLDATLLGIVGTSFSVSGPSSAVLSSTLPAPAAAWSRSNASGGLTLTLALGSFDACAWYHYLAGLPVGAGLGPNEYRLIPASASLVDCRSPGAAPQMVALELTHLESVGLNLATIDLSLSSGGG
ncbi:MAG: hypothetical protein ACYCPN_04425 [Thermoplasmata archaeon]